MTTQENLEIQEAEVVEETSVAEEFKLPVGQDNPYYKPSYVELMDGNKAIYVETLFASTDDMMERLVNDSNTSISVVGVKKNENAYNLVNMLMIDTENEICIFGTEGLLGTNVESEEELNIIASKYLKQEVQIIPRGDAKKGELYLPLVSVEYEYKDTHNTIAVHQPIITLYGLTSEVKEVERQLDGKEELAACYELIVEPVYLIGTEIYTSSSASIVFLDKEPLEELKGLIDAKRKILMSYYDKTYKDIDTDTKDSEAFLNKLLEKNTKEQTLEDSKVEE